MFYILLGKACFFLQFWWKWLATTQTPQHHLSFLLFWTSNRGVVPPLQQFSINLNLIHYVEQPRMLRQFKRKQTLNMLAGCWIVLESLVWSPVYAVLDTYASPAAAKHDCLLERKRWFFLFRRYGRNAGHQSLNCRMELMDEGGHSNKAAKALTHYYVYGCSHYAEYH